VIKKSESNFFLASFYVFGGPPELSIAFGDFYRNWNFLVETRQRKNPENAQILPF
jgi:hypothetical protein